jgi:Domain of unknown function (DUF4383)
MNAPTIARILGLLFLIAGIAGFVPWISPVAPLDAPVISIDTAYRFIGGVFPVNAAHDAIHLLFGVWGLLAASRFGAAVAYCRTVAVVYLLLVALGAIPIFAFYTLFGIAPIYGWDVALHLVLALFAAYGGYGRASIEPEAAAAV